MSRSTWTLVQAPSFAIIIFYHSFPTPIMLHATALVGYGVGKAPHPLLVQLEP